VQPELTCVLMTTAIDSQTAIAALRRRAYAADSRSAA
jgi:hypothetical protein